MNPESLQYIGCHTHLNFTHFEHDRKKVISEMKKKNIGAINIGIDQETSRESIELAKEYEHIWASVGCHPTEATPNFSIHDYQTLLPQLGTAAVPNDGNNGEGNQTVVAVGECGLDYSRSEYRTKEYKQLQEDVFVQQIKLAAEAGLPLVLHIRPQEGGMDAYEDALEILSHFQTKLDTDLTGTAHFFVGSKAVAKRFLDLEFYISFTGPITFDNRLQDVCSYLPADRLLAETDSPFAAPKPHRGKRNSPLYLPRIIEQIASARSVTSQEMQTQLLENTRKLFGIRNG